jgi:hypothetical protein
MWYLSKTERVLCPVTFIATHSGTPKLTMFLTAVCRKSCRSMPGQPAFRQAVFQAFLKSLDLPAPMSPLQVREEVGDNLARLTFQRSNPLYLRRQKRLQFGGKIDEPRLVVLSRPRFEA